MVRVFICLLVAVSAGCNLFGETAWPSMPDAESGRDAGDDAHDVRVTNDVRDNTLSDACNAGSTHDACGEPSCEDGTCTCVESDQAFCQRLGKDCDTVFARDACGVERTVDCGTCSAPAQCGGGGSENVCGCPLESDTIFCARIGAPCGNVTATDSCNTERTTYCGTCGAGEMCVDNTCVCERETDAVFCERVLGCGELTALDNCGDFRTIDCQRACPGDEYCVNGQCTCQPEPIADFCTRHGAMCGGVDAPDNCGVVRTEDCGTCPASDNVCWENRCNAFPSNGLVLNVAAAVGVTETSTSRVSRWTDQVSGRRFTASGGDQPLRIVGHYGHEALRFSGSQQLQTDNPLDLTQSFTMSLVIQRRPTSERGTFLSGDGFLNASFSFGYTPDTLHIGTRYIQGLTFTVLSTEQLDVLTIRKNSFHLQVYQGHQETASTSVFSFGGVEISHIGTSERADTGLRGDIYEILIWNRSLTDTEIDVVVAELYDRYDLSP